MIFRKDGVRIHPFEFAFTGQLNFGSGMAELSASVVGGPAGATSIQ